MLGLTSAPEMCVKIHPRTVPVVHERPFSTEYARPTSFDLFCAIILHKE